MFGDQLTGEIEAMGIDPAALLPKGRVEEIAAAVQTGDALGAREVVRALAPAAIRRLARRLMTDPSFNDKAVAYVLGAVDILRDQTAVVLALLLALAELAVSGA